MVEKVLLKMIHYFGNDIKRINHALKVYGFAKAISSSEGISGAEKTIIELTAILHDIGIKEAERKHSSSAGKYQEIEGPEIANNILLDSGISNSIISRVCFIIGNHHSYQKIDGIDFQILVEADFLVNIFEENIESESIQSIKEKIFKTSSGIMILESIYSTS